MKHFPKPMETVEEQIKFIQDKTHITDMEKQILKSLKLMKDHFCNPSGTNIVVSLSKEKWKDVSHLIT